MPIQTVVLRPNTSRTRPVLFGHVDRFFFVSLRIATKQKHKLHTFVIGQIVIFYGEAPWNMPTLPNSSYTIV